MSVSEFFRGRWDSVIKLHQKLEGKLMHFRIFKFHSQHKLLEKCKPLKKRTKKPKMEFQLET